MNRSRSVTYFLAAGSAGLALLMVKYPATAVNASLQGLQLWWNKVFPALFPFFVLSELMIGFGVVTFAGVLLEPVMRPLFKVPGIGGFVFMMGLISGFPAGARITARLYEEKKLTKIEAERLSSFTNFSNPLFLFSVTAVGFFHQAVLGIVFALAHYTGNIGVGLMMRFYKSGKSSPVKERDSRSVFSKALRSMHAERLNRYQPFGKTLGDAVTSSVSILLTIGGFIALFSMVNQLMIQIGVSGLLEKAFGSLLGMIGFAPELGSAAVPGIFELTIGALQIGGSPAPLTERVVLASALLGFCGFSIQAQAVSILSQAGLSAKPFLIGRLFHAFFSGVAALFLYRFFHINEKLKNEPSFALSPQPGFFSNTGLSIGPLVTVSVLLIFIMILLNRMMAAMHRK
ncbi:sporulation integral membrane protein YlbJ [Sporolactobacillus putidus]|uniref:Sporulation integral membrane protein YlbJ n=1 Tax=Sporolactobacillus putidus TaxID=492735 RepID=A0A917VZS0_9BACL|nr:sporulation integral membrane protein YlbJ [Sporolactobacillus putidus]GGL44872.1 sporulation integral membrane protein YlbJ [Sporolactobacillus putidus]